MGGNLSKKKGPLSELTKEHLDYIKDFLATSNKVIPRIGENGNWFIGSVDTGLPSRGDAFKFPDFTDEQLESLKVKGDPGYTPVKGTDYFTPEEKAAFIAELALKIPTTDSELSETSTNPVQNKVIALALKDKVSKEEGKGFSTNDLTDEKNDVLKNILDGVLVLADSNGVKTHIYYDGLASGYPFYLSLSGGSIDNCNSVSAEIMQYLDMETGYMVDVSEAIRGLNSRVDGFDTLIRNALGSRESLSFLDIHNSETRCLEILDELTIGIPDGEYPEQFIAGLVFSSGETATTVIYSADSSIIQWVGTDCSSDGNYSVFIPMSNKNYNIVFYFNGTHFVGLVNGYETVTSNTEV